MIAAGLRVPVTLEQLRAGAKMDGSRAESHQLKAEEIDAIRRFQSRGFRVIDLDPNLLDRAEFTSVYTNDILSNITGENLQGTGIDSSGSAGCVNPYWRSFSFDCPGNWMKIEILPVRREVAITSTLTTLEQPISLYPSGTNDETLAPVISEASRRTVLLDFEAPTSSPHIVSDGMTFHTYFSSFILTLKNLNTRIRITIGYNSKIEENEQKETSLCLFGGRGITTRGQSAPTPFSINSLDVNPSSNLGVAYPPPYSTFVQPLIICPGNPAPLQTDIGNSNVWITSFSGLVYNGAGASTNNGLMKVELDLWEVNGAYSPVSALKRITTLYMKIKSGENIGEFTNITLAEPIRVSLPPFTAICLKLIEVVNASASGTRFVQFELGGYVLGGLAANEISGLAVAPFYTIDFAKENPWPLDYNFSGIPQR